MIASARKVCHTIAGGTANFDFWFRTWFKFHLKQSHLCPYINYVTIGVLFTIKFI